MVTKTDLKTPAAIEIAMTEEFAPMATQDLNVLTRKLECCLKVKVTRAVAEHETEVNMDHVPAAVQQDVAVVAVLYLKEVAEQRVACHRLHETGLRCEVTFAAQSLCLQISWLVLYAFNQFFCLGLGSVLEGLFEVLLQACKVSERLLQLIN